MPFPRQATVTPVRIGQIVVTLIDPDVLALHPVDGVQSQSARAEISIVMSDGSIKSETASIPDYFPPATVNQLKAFVASVRAKAIAEIMPAP